MKAMRKMFGIVVVVLGTCGVGAQTVPELINYQGKLMDGTNLFSGTVPMTFRLYDAAEGGAMHYAQTNSVLVVDGLYATTFGDAGGLGRLDTALAQDEAWIEVDIDGTVITPRERLVSVGYARFANALPAGAVDGAMLADQAIREQHIADGQIVSRHLGMGAVSNANLAAGAVDGAMLADQAIREQHIADGQIVSRHLGMGVVSNANLAAGAVTSNKIDWSTMPDIPRVRGYAENGDFADTPQATGNHAIALGVGARAEGSHSVVGGGQNNMASVPWATIGGGWDNQVTGSGRSTIGGGQANIANGLGDTIGGGLLNVTEGTYSTVPGGARNHAEGEYSFAAGHRAKALHRGAFVWADSQNADFESAVTNEFAVRAAGGLRLVGGPFHGDGSELSGLWRLGGNAGTIAGGTNFLGTTDDQPLEFYAHNERVMRLDNSFGMPNVTIGQAGNHINPLAGSATISGGGGLGGGNPNRVTDSYGTIGGGAGNLAGDDAGSVFSAEYATVGGGRDNTAGATAATVGGGRDNTAESAHATVAGGDNNIAGGEISFVGGGLDNVAAARAAAVGGGELNHAGDEYAVVAGGYGNFASAHAATIAGGFGNDVLGDFGAVGGGRSNTVSARHATVAGGELNQAADAYAVVAGGRDNTALAAYAAVGGGRDNLASNNYATVGGGYHNVAVDDYATVGGGYRNVADFSYSVVGGGRGNAAGGVASTIGGGEDNVAEKWHGTVGGGQRNKAVGINATIGGGRDNDANKLDSTIGGGNKNVADGNASVVAGGRQNEALANYSAITGGDSNATDADYSAIAGGREARTDNYAEQAHAAGSFENAGDAQASQFVLRRQTASNGVWEDLFLDGASRYLRVAVNETVTFDALVVARSSTGLSASYRVEGMLRHMTGMGVIPSGVTVTTLSEDVAAWNVRVAAPMVATQDVYFQVQGSGEVIRWVASVRAVRVKW